VLEGSNVKNIKKSNRILILRLIALNASLSRVELAELSGLSKMAAGNLVRELIEQDIVEEISGDNASSNAGQTGRPQIKLKVSGKSPCVCGMLIKRGYCQVILADISGNILEHEIYRTPLRFNAAGLVKNLLDGFHKVSSRCQRKVLAIGIASIGPINAAAGVILNPPDYHGIKNLHITELIEQETHIQTHLINDANAGALAEKMYGHMHNGDDFIYLHIMNGIGAGLILDNRLYNGNFGQSGEIGHTSINYTGAKCACGNVGCLDLYANLHNLREYIKEYLPLYPQSTLKGIPAPEWLDILDAANDGDGLAIAALGQFCGYISNAIVNVLNMLDIQNLIVGYDSNKPGDIIEKLLENRISDAVLFSSYRNVEVQRSLFHGDAPLIGSIAHIVNLIFNYQIDI